MDRQLDFLSELCIPPPQTHTFSSSDAMFPRTAAMPPEIATVPYGPRKKQLRAQSQFSMPLPVLYLLDKARCSLPGSCHTGGHREHRGSPPHSAGGPAKGRPGPLQSGRHPPTWMAALEREGRGKCAIMVKVHNQPFCGLTAYLRALLLLFMGSSEMWLVKIFSLYYGKHGILQSQTSTLYFYAEEPNSQETKHMSVEIKILS